ncbi:MAG: helix-turn-helix transcriptional regulator [Butyrivibrio sp.]|nr:helix-turn-helix transcriptional regulator [Butyrivibrio sp.]
MQINEVIRKYRKEKKLTQEEMATRLGVTAPAVNKWESGASMPDITLLAPIARLLGISLDELLSYNADLSDIEVSNILNEIYAMFNTESIDTVYQRMVDIVREYPNAEKLILSLASLLLCKSVVAVENRSKYDEWIENCYEKLVTSENETIRLGAADALYAFYISKEKYEEAEDCLRFYSEKDPEKKRKLALIYSRTGRYDEAYKLMEEALFTDYQIMSVLLHEIFSVSIDTKNFNKAQKIMEKESALAELFEMGEYHKNAGRLELAIALKENDKALEYMESLIADTDTMTGYMKSDLYEHMEFKESDPILFETTRTTMLKQFAEHERYKDVRKLAGWKEFKKKYY